MRTLSEILADGIKDSDWTYCKAEYAPHDGCKIGMPEAFTDQADFSDMSEIPQCISDVIQSTFIAVDEEGTEAAAVTSVIVSTTGLPVQRETRLVELNRPFAFFILDSGNNALFAGKILDPTK